MMKLNFSDIPFRSGLPSQIRKQFTELYYIMYDNIVCNYNGKSSYKSTMVEAVNLLAYFLIKDGDIPFDWDISDLSTPLPYVYDSSVRKILGNLYLEVSDVNFDIEQSEVVSEDVPQKKEMITEEDIYAEKTVVFEKPHTETFMESRTFVSEPTPKEDLFITFPTYPRIGSIDSKYPTLYKSLPDIPKKQSEISSTTNPDQLTTKDVLTLYPNRFIRTRSEIMYREFEGITLDPEYGLLLPVEGFTDSQVRDSIIRYPHIFKLKRNVDGELRNFYNEIEIDGELLPILDIWDYLLESDRIPIKNEAPNIQAEFIKEYAIRRYLLERDIKGVKHKYPVYGDLGEFITLFMPSSKYEQEGYGDAVTLARTCVKNRRDYMASRNPRLVCDSSTLSIHDCPFGAFCTASVCDRSCPTWTQFSYLLKQNNLTLNSSVFQISDNTLEKFNEIYDKAQKKTLSVVSNQDTNSAASIFSYIGICRLWNGSVLRTDVYNLRFSKYLDMMQSSFSNNKSDDFEYMCIWAKEAKVLIISGMDYINFKEFQSQQLLQLIQDREDSDLTTLIVTPKPENLSGQGKLFNLLLNKLKRNITSLS